ncbi:MAG: TonB-dependent receptor [Thermoanaerobaculia bacterium]
MNSRFPVLLFLVLALVAASAFSQSMPTGTLSGKVTADGAGLPGVLVTATSPNLQGERTTVTTGTGDYILPLLPPGAYTVQYELSGLRTATRKAALSGSRVETIDVELRPSAMSEAITVTANTPLTAAVESTQVATNFNQDTIELLPVARNLQSVTLLSPGVTPNGPSGNIMISGAMSYDSLYLVNGAIVNENLRGQAHDLFIEDAVQETTVMTGAVSAEFGHFTGGVVNAITKSGSNNFKGSFRTNFSNESWTSKTPFTDVQADEINKVYEATLGGPILRDRLWFFGAGRDQDTEDIAQTSFGTVRTGDISPVRITYPHGTEERRLEGKLTGTITQKHSLVASYIDIDEVEINNRFTASIMDLASLNPERETPNTLMAVNYTGSLTQRFFIEAQYSKKDYAFLGSGARCYDLICGTLVEDRARGTRYNSATFKYKPEGEQRDHELYTIKGTYFWTSPRFGTHDIRVGYDDFMEVRDVNNHQSGSDFRISVTSTIVRGSEIFPRAVGGSTGTLTRINWYPIFVLSDGSEYGVTSMYVNDRWNLNDHWSFNLGVRYDKNDAMSGAGTFQISEEASFSPRLGVQYDTFTNGRLVFNAGYSEYVGRLAEGVGNDVDPAGRNATLSWYYRGPSINNDVNAPTGSLIPTAEVLKRIFEWFQAQGGTSTKPTRSVSIPGVDTKLHPDGLTAPMVKEFTFGVGSAIGTRGYARADLVFRNWDNFYTAFTDKQTGKVTDDFGQTYDLTLIGNSNIYDRDYTGIQTQFSWRLLPKLNLGGTYTWSRLTGNVTGEDSGSGPLTGVAGNYPEYRGEEWNYPTGYLSADQRHRAKIWASYDLDTPIGGFNFSLLQNFDSGGAYSAEGGISPAAFVTGLDYEDPPEGMSYFFGGRGAYRTDDITRTDFAINYSLKLPRGIELFFQPEVLNVFNEQGVTSHNQEVNTADDETWLKPLNPYSEQPIECPQGAPSTQCQSMGAHWQKGASFGLPDSEGDYQTPRTYRFSVGIRF